jgi:hypothetical protein
MTIFRMWVRDHQESGAEILNPVQRGLVRRPEDWAWSSARHYAPGEECGGEIESGWTARRRGQLGVYPVVRGRDVSYEPRPLAKNARRTGHPLLRGVKAWASP